MCGLSMVAAVYWCGALEWLSHLSQPAISDGSQHETFHNELP